MGILALPGSSIQFNSKISNLSNNVRKPISVNLQQSGAGPWILKLNGVLTHASPFGFKIL